MTNTTKVQPLSTSDELLRAFKAATDPAVKAKLKVDYNEALQHEFDVDLGHATTVAVHAL
jgi:hypothetical protein